MTKPEALEILKLYRNWNEGQKSFSLLLRGVRTQEDDVLDERRKLLICAARTLQATTEEELRGKIIPGKMKA